MRALSNKRTRDRLGGALMALLGIAATIQGSGYRLGTLSQMGPGYFPTALGAILALIGSTLVIFAGYAKHEDEEVPLPSQGRGWLCISSSIVAFVLLGRYAGLVPASFAVAFIAALGDRQNSVKGAAILAGCIVAVAIVVFWWGLHLQLPLFGSR